MHQVLFLSLIFPSHIRPFVSPCDLVQTFKALHFSNQPLLPKPPTTFSIKMNIIIQLFYFLLMFATLRSCLAHPISKRTPFHTINSTRQISSDVFTCDSSNNVVNAICKEALSKFNADLRSIGLSIGSNGLLLTYDDPKDSKISTGHSCSVTAKINHKHASVRFSRGARLNLQMDTITEPFLFSLKLPVKLYARIDVKQRFGQRILGSCANIASDSYSFKADASTTSNIAIGFTLDPKIGTTKAGDYIVQIKPRVTSVLSLDNFKLNFKVSGVNPISQVLTSVLGLGSTLLKSVTALIQGDSVSDIVEKALPFDLGVPIVLGIGSLPGPLERLIWEKLLKTTVVSNVQGRTEEYSNELQESINSKLKANLNLDDNGEKGFIIKKDKISLLLTGASRSDVFIPVPENPLPACLEGTLEFCMPRNCNGGRCPVIVRTVQNPSACRASRSGCFKQHDEWKEKYGAVKLAHSNPLIAQ